MHYVVTGRIGGAPRYTAPVRLAVAVRRGLGEAGRALKERPIVPVPERFQGRLRLVVLAGQSNIEGSGSMDGYVPPPASLAERVFVFDKKYRWTQAVEPVAKGGVGPMVAFGARLLELADDPAMAIGLVPTARGSTNISQWQPSRRDGDLYAEMVKRTRAATVMGELAGMLFFQGEKDTGGLPDDHPDDWAAMFACFAEAARNDLELALPIVFAQIGPNDRGNPRWQAVQEQQRSVHLPNTAMIVTSDLPSANGPHFTTPSYLEIGRRFAESLRPLLRR